MQKLEEDLLKTNQRCAQLNKQNLQDLIDGGNVDEVIFASENTENETEKLNHCSLQEMKKLKKKVDGLQEELNGYQKKNVSQLTVIKQLNEQ